MARVNTSAHIFWGVGAYDIMPLTGAREHRHRKVENFPSPCVHMGPQEGVLALPFPAAEGQSPPTFC